MAQEAFDKSGKFRNRIDQLARQSYLTAPALATAFGPMPNGFPAVTGSAGQLNPAFSRWLQGCPEVWDQCSPNYDDWRRWQDWMAAHSSGPKGTEPED
jgi:hypothetical protein